MNFQYDLIYLPSNLFWPNLVKDKKIKELSVEEVVNKYQEFEGELIFIYQVKEDKSDFIRIVNQCLEISKSENCLLLHVISISEIMPSSPNEQLFKVGYDIGVYEEEKTIYSSIFNEILFGHLDELVAYKNHLNEHLLFQEKSRAEEYVNLHSKLSVEEKGV